jgi:hypothetical protein
MTAIERTHTGNGHIALIALAMLLSVSLLGSWVVQLRPHAVERHGMDAERARDFVLSGGPGGRYKCGDNLYKVIEETDVPGEYAFSVLKDFGGGMLVELTSFTCSEEYAKRQIEDCEPAPKDGPAWP